MVETRVRPADLESEGHHLTLEHPSERRHDAAALGSQSDQDGRIGLKSAAYCGLSNQTCGFLSVKLQTYVDMPQDAAVL
jgi:hypothetical protein